MSLESPLHRELRKYYRENGMDKPLKYDMNDPALVLNGKCVCPACQSQREILAFIGQEPAREKRHIPAGVHFAPGQRVSGELRSRYLDHLRICYEQERIDLSELNARMDAMMIASTEEELKFLLYDLPPLLAATVAPVKEEEKKGWHPHGWDTLGYAGFCSLAFAHAGLILSGPETLPAIIMFFLSLFLGGFFLALAVASHALRRNEKKGNIVV